jgi:hypothetical protein
MDGRIHKVCPILCHITLKTSLIEFLRADVHTLFDLDLIMIEPGSRGVTVAPSLRETDYGSLEGVLLRKPSNPALTPTAAAFEERRKWK